VTAVRYCAPRASQRLFHGAGLPENLGAAPWLAAQLPLFLGACDRVLAREARSVDLVLSHWLLPSGLLAARHAARLGLPHVLVAHSGDVSLPARWLPGPLRAGLAEWVRRGTSRVVFTHAALRELFLARFGPLQDAIVTPMGWNPTAQPPVPATDSHGDPTRPLRLLFLGRLAGVKGPDVLLEALRRVPDAELTLVGDGRLRSTLESSLDGLGSRVRFAGQVAPSGVPAHLARADLLVVPSRRLPSGRSEGVPHAALLAMGHGLPVVASEVGGLPDLVRHERNGLLVPPESPAALAQALNRLASHHDELHRLRLGARATALEHTWDCVMPHVLGGLVPGC
jgi:glycosyltransferase involved in cell wall biosynthesis